MKAGPPRGSARLLSNGTFVVVDADDTIATSSSVSSFASSSSDSSSKVNYIEHCVSRMDTLAGIAIMYGVEVIGIWILYFFLHASYMLSSSFVHAV